MKKLIIVASLCSALTACATHTSSETTTFIGNSAECPTCAPTPAGAVEYVYEPPIVDVIDVPAGLDPEGHYYRPSHQMISEARQGRWEHYKQPRQ